MSEEPLPPLSILVVDDSDDAAQSTAELLTLGGHDVRIASCGADALRDAAIKTPDIVLLDIAMPQMSGWEVANRIRYATRGKQPLIVAVTGYGSEADRWRSADAGCDLHLVKPVEPLILLKLLRWVQKSVATRRRANVLGQSW